MQHESGNRRVPICGRSQLEDESQRQSTPSEDMIHNGQLMGSRRRQCRAVSQSAVQSTSQKSSFHAAPCRRRVGGPHRASIDETRRVASSGVFATLQRARTFAPASRRAAPRLVSTIIKMRARLAAFDRSLACSHAQTRDSRRLDDSPSRRRGSARHVAIAFDANKNCARAPTHRAPKNATSIFTHALDIITHRGPPSRATMRNDDVRRVAEAIALDMPPPVRPSPPSPERPPSAPAVTRPPSPPTVAAAARRRCPPPLAVVVDVSRNDIRLLRRECERARFRLIFLLNTRHPTIVIADARSKTCTIEDSPEPRVSSLPPLLSQARAHFDATIRLLMCGEHASCRQLARNDDRRRKSTIT